MKAFDLYPRKCRMCGKRFESSTKYSYKIGKRKGFYYFCSWHCLRMYEKQAS